MLIAVRNLFFKIAGAIILFGVFAKHRLMGYRKPNTVSDDDRAARIDYVHDVVRSWMRFLPPDISVRGRSVLELGPGSSLATGTLMLAHGATSYTAVDAFRLAGDETPAFRRDAVTAYNAPLEQADVARAISASGEMSDMFSYKVDPAFDIASLCAPKRFDLIVSCAAFEHFNDIDRTIEGLTAVAASGCVSLHIVDMQTHSNVIRARDPNNIYRFSSWFYSLLAFPGQPNRERPIDYVRAFERNGWKDVQVVAAKSIPADQRKALTTGLAERYSSQEAEMQILDAVIISRFP